MGDIADLLSSAQMLDYWEDSDGSDYHYYCKRDRRPITCIICGTTNLEWNPEKIQNMWKLRDKHTLEIHRCKYKGWATRKSPCEEFEDEQG